MLRLSRACGVPWPLPFLPWRHPEFAGSWNDPPRRTLCAKTARLGGGYPHVSSPPAFPFFCEPSRLAIPTFGRRADDRRLPLMWPENRAYFGGHRLLRPWTAGEQPKLCRSAPGDPSSRSLRSNGRQSDGSASPPPDSAPFWSYSCDGMRRECMCVCAAVQVAPILRIPPRKPCDLSGASPTPRTRRLRAVSTWRGSHNATSLPCAQI